MRIPQTPLPPPPTPLTPVRLKVYINKAIAGAWSELAASVHDIISHEHDTGEFVSDLDGHVSIPGDGSDSDDEGQAYVPLMPIQLVGVEGLPRESLVEVEVIALPSTGKPSTKTCRQSIIVHTSYTCTIGRPAGPAGDRQVLYKTWELGVAVPCALHEDRQDGVYDWPLFTGSLGGTSSRAALQLQQTPGHTGASHGAFGTCTVRASYCPELYASGFCSVKILFFSCLKN